MVYLHLTSHPFTRDALNVHLSIWESKERRHRACLPEGFFLCTCLSMFHTDSLSTDWFILPWFILWAGVLLYHLSPLDWRLLGDTEQNIFISTSGITQNLYLQHKNLMDPCWINLKKLVILYNDLRLGIINYPFSWSGNKLTYLKFVLT